MYIFLPLFLMLDFSDRLNSILIFELEFTLAINGI